MCDHIDCRPFTKASSASEPIDRDHCHIYYVHQHGTVYRHPNARFRDSGSESSNEEKAPKIEAHVEREGVVKTDGNSAAEGNENDKEEESSKENVRSDVAKAFCGDDRLTLIHLPSIPKPIKNNLTGSPSSKCEVVSERLLDILPTFIPPLFAEKLKNICEHCECKKEILWSNLLRDEQHFDACFRYVNKTPTPNRRCFLKLYTPRVPFLSDLTVTFSMVHHIRAEGAIFVQADKTKTDNQEHMFGFIYGLDGKQLQTLLTDLVSRWQDIVGDHPKPSTGVTPRLFVAALLSNYGSIISARIRNVYKNLQICDDDLQTATEKLRNQLPEPSIEQISRIRAINENLVGMNRQLTGTRSTMHYLADSADVLVNNITTFEEYVEARLDEWGKDPQMKKLKEEALPELDTCREKTRDHDKLVIIRKDMLQYKRISKVCNNISTSTLVSNLLAERDRFIQQYMSEHQVTIAENTAKDGAKMKVMAILTAFFLPGTFMAVLLTTPIFNFVDDTKPLLTKDGTPLGIYWGVTGLGFVLLLIGLHRLDMNAKSEKKKDRDGGAKAEKEKPNNENKRTLEQQSQQANEMKGESTSTDGSSQGESTSARWVRGLRRGGRVVLCGDCV